MRNYLLKINRMFCFLSRPDFLFRRRYTVLACCVMRRHLAIIELFPYLGRRAPDRGSCDGVGTERTRDASGGSKRIDMNRNVLAPPSLWERRHNVQETGQPVQSVPGTNESPHCACACTYVCTHAQVFYIISLHHLHHQGAAKDRI